jgi:hypothetical protein
MEKVTNTLNIYAALHLCRSGMDAGEIDYQVCHESVSTLDEKEQRDLLLCLDGMRKSIVAIFNRKRDNDDTY